MDAKLKKKWVAALRSGKFKQARNKLSKGKNHHCCIGVGAVLVDKRFDLINDATCNAAMLLGLTDAEQDKLVDMNDYQHRSFKTIADYIEANL